MQRYASAMCDDCSARLEMVRRVSLMFDVRCVQGPLYPAGGIERAVRRRWCSWKVISCFVLWFVGAARRMPVRRLIVHFALGDRGGAAEAVLLLECTLDIAH
eukprot:IDg13842t1